MMAPVPLVMATVQWSGGGHDGTGATGDGHSAMEWRGP